MSVRGYLSAAGVGLWAMLAGCSTNDVVQEDPEVPPRSLSAYVGKDEGIPEWFLIRFVLDYPDGRRYEGECTWPEDYYRKIQVDIAVSKDMVKPGKTVTSIREVSGPDAQAFTPHGKGTMYYPDGRRTTGMWHQGTFAGAAF